MRSSIAIRFPERIRTFHCRQTASLASSSSSPATGSSSLRLVIFLKLNLRIMVYSSALCLHKYVLFYAGDVTFAHVIIHIMRIFFFSACFYLQTISKTEVKLVKSMLLQYYQHFMKYPWTFINKIVNMYRLR